MDGYGFCWEFRWLLRLALDVAPRCCWVYSLASTVFMLIVGIRVDLVGELLALATDRWFRSTMAGGFASGDSVNASFCGWFNLFDNGGASPDL